MTEKIKAINPEIIVRGCAEKPYYQIKYYDTADKRYHIGFGSYYYENVLRWLKEYFEPPIEVDEQPVVHGRWYMRGGRACCSNCNIKALWKSDWDGDKNHEREFVSAKSNYCPNCGAKMD